MCRQSSETVLYSGDGSLFMACFLFGYRVALVLEMTLSVNQQIKLGK